MSNKKYIFMVRSFTIFFFTILSLIVITSSFRSYADEPLPIIDEFVNPYPNGFWQNGSACSYRDDNGRCHAGNDIYTCAESGVGYVAGCFSQPVYSMTNGRVIYSGKANNNELINLAHSKKIYDNFFGVSGNVVLIEGINEQGKRVITAYAHGAEDTINLKTGDVVNAGDYLMWSGDTGWATGDPVIHLHVGYFLEGDNGILRPQALDTVITPYNDPFYMNQEECPWGCWKTQEKRCDQACVTCPLGCWNTRTLTCDTRCIITGCPTRCSTILGCNEECRNCPSECWINYECFCSESTELPEPTCPTYCMKNGSCDEECMNCPPECWRNYECLCSGSPQANAVPSQEIVSVPVNEDNPPSIPNPLAWLINGFKNVFSLFTAFTVNSKGL